MDVRYQQVAKTFAGVEALVSLDLEVADGKFMALLGIPPDVTPVVLIPVAYVKGELSRPSRLPVDGVIFWERWGARR